MACVLGADASAVVLLAAGVRRAAFGADGHGGCVAVAQYGVVGNDDGDVARVGKIYRLAGAAAALISYCVRVRAG